MNEVTAIDKIVAQPAEPVRKKTGMTPEEAAYMRGPVAPVAGSVPMSTSKYLNSPLFVHAWKLMSLRRMGDDVACTYDIPDMSRGLADVADYGRAAELVAAEREINPEFAAWLDRRQVNDFSPDSLKEFAPGTLGATLYDFMVHSGMELNFINQYEAQSDLEYLLKRNGETHDILHMASGFGPNMAGENALAFLNIASAFRYFSPELAQVIAMPNIFVSAASLARIGFNYPGGMSLILEAFKLGVEAGEQVKKPLFMVDWPEYFDWTLEDITRHLGFGRGPGKDWDYSETTCSG